MKEAKLGIYERVMGSCNKKATASAYPRCLNSMNEGRQAAVRYRSIMPTLKYIYTCTHIYIPIYVLSNSRDNACL